MSANADVLRGACAAINRGDADWLVERSDPEIEMHMVGVAGEPVLYRGHDGIREWFGDMAEIWDSVEFVPGEIDDRGDRLSAIVTMRLRGRASGLELNAPAALVYELRDGRAVRLRAHPGVATLDEIT